MKKLLVALMLLVMTPAMRADFVQGSQTCPASGNIQVSTSSYNLYQLTVSATITNTGRVYLGGNGVTTSSGAYMIAGGSYTAVKPSAGVNPVTLYIACTVAADTITWTGSR